MSWYIKVLKNYFNFSGRARRKEYWMFQLINGTITLLLVIGMFVTMPRSRYYSNDISASPLYYLFTIYLLAVALPSLAVLVRRLHDTDRSGWWVLISWLPILGPIFLLIFTILPGTQGDNSFGPDPLDDFYDVHEDDDYYTPPGKRRQNYSDSHSDQPMYQSPRKNTQGSPTYGAPRARNHDNEDFSPSMIANNDSFGAVRRNNSDKPYVDPFSKKDNGPSDEELFARFGLMEESSSETTPSPPETNKPPRR